VSYHEASGGKYVPRAALVNLEASVIDAATLSRHSAPAREIAGFEP
jgi:hypothetical protein